MRFVYLFLTVLCVTASTCRKEESKPTVITPISNPIDLEQVWSSFLADNHGPAFNNNPILNRENNVLTSSLFNPIGREIFKLYDGKTGTLKWTWDDYLRNEEGFFDEAHLVFDDIMVLSMHNATYAFNIVTGQTLWKNFIDTMYGNSDVYKDDKGNVYKLFTGEHGSHMIYVFRTHHQNLEWELICALKDSTESYTKYNPLALTSTRNRNGEEVVVFTTFKYKGNLLPTPAEIVCYNLTQHKIDWIRDYTNRYGEFTVGRIASNLGRVFAFASMGSNYFLCCFDVNTGDLLWENKLPNFGVSMQLYKNGLIVTCNNASPVRCYYQNTGYMKWEQRFDETILPKLNFESGATIIHHEFLFSTQCDEILVLNADYGKVLYFGTGGDPEACFQSGVAINETDHTFYVGDRRSINCFKIPASVK